jgi:hypothetical protein
MHEEDEKYVQISKRNGWTGVDCIHVAQNWHNRRTVVNTVMNIRIA